MAAMADPSVDDGGEAVQAGAGKNGGRRDGPVSISSPASSWTAAAARGRAAVVAEENHDAHTAFPEKIGHRSVTILNHLVINCFRGSKPDNITNNLVRKVTVSLHELVIT